MSTYLDASVLVALFTVDLHSQRADNLLESISDNMIVSDFAAAEFASAVSRKVRMGDLDIPDARAALSDFDGWIAGSVNRVESQPSDMVITASFLRRMDLPLRTPDSLNLAIAQRLGAIIATLDRRMAVIAAQLGLSVAPEP